MKKKAGVIFQHTLECIIYLTKDMKKGKIGKKKKEYFFFYKRENLEELKDFLTPFGLIFRENHDYDVSKIYEDYTIGCFFTTSADVDEDNLRLMMNKKFMTNDPFPNVNFICSE